MNMCLEVLWAYMCVREKGVRTCCSFKIHNALQLLLPDRSPHHHHPCASRSQRIFEGASLFKRVIVTQNYMSITSIPYFVCILWNETQHGNPRLHTFQIFESLRFQVISVLSGDLLVFRFVGDLLVISFQENVREVLGLKHGSTRNAQIRNTNIRYESMCTDFDRGRIH